jgi:hypothetical protein
LDTIKAIIISTLRSLLPMIIHLQKIANEVEWYPGIETLAIHCGNLTILLQKSAFVIVLILLLKLVW